MLLRKCLEILIITVLKNILVNCTAVGNQFSHVYRLQNLFLKEEGIVAVLRKAYFNNNKQIEVADYLNRFKSREQEVPLYRDKNDLNEHLEAIMDKLVGNPVHVYTLIYRYVELLPKIKERLNEELTGYIDSIITNQKEQVPTEFDLDGAALSLARIQFTYKLDPRDLAKGIIYGIQTNAKLEADELMDIAERRIAGRTPSKHGHPKDYAVAYEFAEAGLQLAKSEQQQKAFSTLLMSIRADHNWHWLNYIINPVALPNEAFFIQKIIGNMSAANLGQRLRQTQAETLLPELQKDDLTSADSHNIHVFHGLCRGERFRFRVPDAAQFCYYSIFSSAIVPILKVEMLSVDPPIYVFHEVLNEKAIKKIRNIVGGRLETASVQNIKDGVSLPDRKFTSERIQATGWIWEHEQHFLYNVSQRIETLTNLKLVRPDNSWINTYVESEAWQVGVYGPGGHYLPHYDVLQGHRVTYNDNGLYIGNRIATAMFYLTNLTGGGTAFPKIGVAARPRAGSLVFWYNLKHTGEQEMLALHGACPTALGIKWVANKWILEAAQTFRRKCEISVD